MLKSISNAVLFEYLCIYPPTNSDIEICHKINDFFSMQLNQYIKNYSFTANSGTNAKELYSRILKLLNGLAQMIHTMYPGYYCATDGLKFISLYKEASIIETADRYHYKIEDSYPDQLKEAVDNVIIDSVINYRDFLLKNNKYNGPESFQGCYLLISQIAIIKAGFPIAIYEPKDLN